MFFCRKLAHTGLHRPIRNTDGPTQAGVLKMCEIELNNARYTKKKKTKNKN